MHRLRAAVEQTISFLLMLVTLRRGRRERPFIKVPGRPLFKGGPATKFEQLAPILAPRFAPYSTVLCLSSVSTPLIFLRILKLLGARILLNQNGVYYPAWFPKGWERKNAYLRKLNALADHVFFQSEFALKSYAHWVGEPPAKRSLLYNAVDVTRFTPGPERTSSPVRVLVFMDVSAFTRSAWEHVLAFRKQMPLDGFEWVDVGRIHDARIARELGVKPRTGDIPAILRECDVALHLVYNDVCPNKVLECMASGVWVIGSSAGGTAELLGDSGTVLTVHEGYKDPEYPSYEGIREALLDFAKHRSEYRTRAIARAQKFRLGDWLNAVELAKR